MGSAPSDAGSPYAHRLALGEADRPLRVAKANEGWPGDVPRPVAIAVNILLDTKCNTEAVRRLLACDQTGAAHQAVDYVVGQILLARAARPDPTPASRRLHKQRRGSLAGWLQRLVAAGADLTAPCARHRGQAVPPAVLARRLHDADSVRLLEQAEVLRARAATAALAPPAAQR